MQNKSFSSSILSIFSILVNAVVTKDNARPFINAKVQGVPLVFLYDTGAGATLMSSKDFRKIRIEDRPPRMPHFQRLVSASGDEIPVV